jgi:hypothetical protein
MAKQQVDKFANQAVIVCVESAANTLTFKKLETGVSLFEKVGWLISRIDYFWHLATLDLLVAASDISYVALTATDQMTSLPLTNAAIIDEAAVGFCLRGTAASFEIRELTITHDLSTLPGGGILIPPNPIYGAIMSASLATAATVTMKIFYTNYALDPDEYWELVESRRIISSS